jgi:hypothetical protein
VLSLDLSEDDARLICGVDEKPTGKEGQKGEQYMRDVGYLLAG